MEQTFMTIHNLSGDANLLFASDSITDILGYQPHEVQGRSCFDYFHPEEVPFARTVHSRGVQLDKAAVLHYLRIQARDGRWISCECCFTVVHDVLVACTSIYRRGEKSERRAIEAPQIRRLFSCSPRDPRYHMLEHLSPKFKMPPMEREPRAALILNRFTRTLTVMFATNAVTQILGVRPDQIQHKSFYECIAENCLADAIKCLESAKANDSIAYLRFWYRDPRREEDFAAEEEVEQNEDENEDMMSNDSNNSTDSDGGAPLNSAMDIDSDLIPGPEIKMEPSSPELSNADIPESSSSANAESYSSSGPSSYRTHSNSQAPAAVPQAAARPVPAQAANRRRRGEPIPTFELEAVVSCTSDGLVVVLRKARPPIPTVHPPSLLAGYENGLFAAPWGEQPVNPYFPPEMLYHFRPPLMPQYMPLQETVKAAGGPPIDQLMRSIRDVAVFAWAVVGINGNLAAHCRGVPQGEAQPPNGLPIWDPTAGPTSYIGPENQAVRRWAQHSSGAYKGKGVMVSEGQDLPGFTADVSQSYGSTSSVLSNMNSAYTHAPSWPSPGPYQPTFEAQHTLSYSQQMSPALPTYHGHSTPPQYPRQNINHYAVPTTQAQSPRDSPTHHPTWE